MQGSEVRVAVDAVVLSLTEPGDVTPTGQPVFLADPRSHPPFAGCQALPGSFIQPGEDLERAVERVLTATLTGPDGVTGGVRHLEQLATFGRPDRDPRGRVISVSYLALAPRPLPVRGDSAWHPAFHPPAMAFDHEEILATAVARLRGKLSYSTVAYGLLPDEFTLSELQAVYEAVLARAMDKRNFRKKVLALGLVAETGEVRRGPHRPAQLYRFTPPGVVVLDDVIAT